MIEIEVEMDSDLLIAEAAGAAVRFCFAAVLAEFGLPS